MYEYLTEAINTTHNMPINSQSMLASFRSALEAAVKMGLIEYIVLY